MPAFYQDFARIIKAGYVRQILTTNIDSLIEQALESQGLARDVDFEVVSQRARAITPVPGGVGPMTRAKLLVNTLRAARR